MNTKGGCGKSLLAYNVAGMVADQGYRVVLLDADRQGSAWEMYRARTRELPFTVQHVPDSLDEALTHRSEEVTIVDSPPNHDEIAMILMDRMDTLVIPMNPTPQDLRATTALLPLLRHSQMKRTPPPRVLFVFNRVRPRLAIVETMYTLADRLGVFPTISIPETCAFQEASFAGLPLHRWEADHKAVTAIELLTQEVTGWPNDKS